MHPCSGRSFLDENGEELKGCGGDLIKIKKIDISGLNPLIKECRFTVMCDVTNPLCGKDGATYTFGRQKGATPEIQDELEKGMCNYRDIIQKQFGMDMDNVKGAGAAGGLGTALMVFLNGTLKSGIETVLICLTLTDAGRGRCSSYRRGSYRLAVRIWKSHAGRWYTLQGAWYTGGGNCWKYGQRGRRYF